MIPTIETERLILRAPRTDDYEAYSAMWSESEVLRYTQRVAPNREMMWARFLRGVGFWYHLGYGLFTIEEKGSGRFVGQLGFFDARREIEPSMEGLPEAGWALRGAFHGRGYGKEAAGALIRWGEGALAGQRAVAIIDPQNQASQALAHHLGFRAATQTLYRGEPILLLDRTL